jgi:hypothetical protein
MRPIYNNFSSTTLASDITNLSSTLTVQAGNGNFFPSPGNNEYVVLVIENIAGAKEIVHMTSRTVDVFSIDRAQEDTVAQSFLAGSRVELRLTQGFLENFVDGGEF